MIIFCIFDKTKRNEMKKPTNKAECEALIKELQAMTFNELPKRWDELDTVKGFCVNETVQIEGFIRATIHPSNRNIFPTSDQAEASIYLAMLMQLRDVYREGWVPYWGEEKDKYLVLLESDTWIVESSWIYNAPFSFQTKERAELFLENFGDYLEKVKPLFS